MMMLINNDDVNNTGNKFVKESFGQAIIDDVTRKRDANQRPARACLMGKRDANQRPAQACLSRPVKTGFCGQTIKGTDQNRVKNLVQ